MNKLILSQFSKIVPIKTAYLRYAVCGCCLCIKNANCYNFGIVERLRTLHYPIFTRGIAKIYGSSHCIFLRENAK